MSLLRLVIVNVVVVAVVVQKPESSREETAVLPRVLRRLRDDVLVAEGREEPSSRRLRLGRAVVVGRVEGGAALNAKLASARAVVTLSVRLGVGRVVGGLVVREGRVLTGVGVAAGLGVGGGGVGVLLVRLLLVLLVIVVVAVVVLGLLVGGVGLYDKENGSAEGPLEQWGIELRPSTGSCAHSVAPPY